MLRRGGVVAAASVAGLTLLDQRRAEAATGGNFVLGASNDANNITELHPTPGSPRLVPLFHVNGASLSGTSTTMIVDGPGGASGLALQVNGRTGGTGISASAATSTSGTVGLALGASGSGGADAINASSDHGRGIAASSTSGTGVAGASGTGAGVTGSGLRGGVFTGKAANVQLTAHKGLHPKFGAAGDLFVDRNHHLWFCRGGTSWVRLA